MRLTDLDDRYSLIQYINEDCVSSYKMKTHVERIDEEFFKPWARYLEEQQLTADQINQIFQAAHKETQAGGGNSTMLGKIVEKIIPDSMLKKLSDSLPEPDPNAAADPQFEQKASAAVNQLEVPAETKQGLMAVVKNAAKNPAVQPVVLSLVGAVLGGILSRAGPVIAATFPGGGTAAVGITGAIVAGGVSIAAAKIQGKGWKEAFKGAIKPALAGAAGAVVGKLAADFMANVGKGSDDTGINPEQRVSGGTDELSPAEQRKVDNLTGKFPPDQYEYKDAGGGRVSIFDADGNQVAQMDIKSTGMNGQQFADYVEGGSAGGGAGGGGKPVQTQSREYFGKRLSEGQCYLIFDRVSETNHRMILEGYLVTEAGLMQKAGAWLKTKAQNVTQQVTADKLMQAWKKAKSPTDSDAVADIMQQAGVNPEVVKKVYTDMKLPSPGTGKTMAEIAAIKKEIDKLGPDTKKQMFAFLQQQLGTA